MALMKQTNPCFAPLGSDCFLYQQCSAYTRPSLSTRMRLEHGNNHLWFLTLQDTLPEEPKLIPGKLFSPVLGGSACNYQLMLPIKTICFLSFVFMKIIWILFICLFLQGWMMKKNCFFSSPFSPKSPSWSPFSSEMQNYPAVSLD